MESPLHDGTLEGLLDRLHGQSDAQRDAIGAFLADRRDAGRLGMACFDDEMHRCFSDKMVTLDRDKALFCYLTCRTLRAARVVEAGTSYGVSTLYLAAAVRDNEVADGMVIGTEFEPAKAAAARANFAAAGLERFIELREGDLLQTLQSLDGPIDFMLIDIWEVALPALRLVAPHLRPGAVVICDNTLLRPDYYRDYFAFLRDPANGFATMTLPFDGGLEYSVRI